MEPDQSKSHSDTEQLDKKFLIKAKDNRDLIENNIKEIETRITGLLKAFKLEDNKVTANNLDINAINANVQDAQLLLEALNEVIEEKNHLLTVVEQNLTTSIESYNHTLKDKAALDEENKMLKQEKSQLDEKMADYGSQIFEIESILQGKQSDLLILNDKLKMKQNQVDEILQQIKSLQTKLDSISNEFSNKTENFKELDEKISKKQEELDRIKDVIEAEQKTTNNLIQTQVAKIGEIQSLSDEIDSKNLLLQQLETKIQVVQDKLNDQNDQKVTMDSVLEKYQTQLSQKMYEFTTIDSKLGDQKSKLEEMQAKEKDLENILNLKEQRVTENSSILKKLLSDIEIKRGEYNAMDVAQTKVRDENENLAKIHQEIEQNIQESNVSFQKLKKDLEIQEKQIRDKESRIHRLEIFSFLYRISKIFGGFVLGIGLLFLIVSFGFLFGVINSTEIAWSLIQPLLMLSGLLFIVSGILQLERM